MKNEPYDYFALSSFGITEQELKRNIKHYDFGTLSSFGITELNQTRSRASAKNAPYFGTLSSFGITEQ